MKKLVLAMVFTLFVFILGGCDFFGTPYDKMMNAFEAVIINQNAIDIEVETSMDFLTNYYGLDDTTTNVSMTYFIDEEEVALETTMLEQKVNLYIAQRGDTLLAYYIDDEMLLPIEMEELEGTVPFDSTIFHLEDYTGKEQWESDFVETEEGVFEVEVELETLFDDEMFQDVEESFTSVGATIESLVGKIAKITVSYDETTHALTMIFDLESFEIVIANTTYELKLDEVITISPSTKTPINYQLYHTYPVESIEHINRTYQVNEDIKGDLYQDAVGYFKFHLTPGNYIITIKDNAGTFNMDFYDKNLNLLTRNVTGTYTITTEGDYYLKITSRQGYGHFIIAIMSSSY
ncbi:MAG: hypothetical protein CVV56_06745 [Tenericutes bacterium HGW-Tenericutes-1]|jgi:hypothetical protein|nr:MAG: hypothetical protein CVV56_06745 [Tenericutes bacterium HGW-Tenericutes-1]